MQSSLADCQIFRGRTYKLGRGCLECSLVRLEVVGGVHSSTPQFPAVDQIHSGDLKAPVHPGPGLAILIRLHKALNVCPPPGLALVQRYLHPDHCSAAPCNCNPSDCLQLDNPLPRQASSPLCVGDGLYCRLCDPNCCCPNHCCPFWTSDTMPPGCRGRDWHTMELNETAGGHRIYITPRRQLGVTRADEHFADAAPLPQPVARAVCAAIKRHLCRSGTLSCNAEAMAFSGSVCCPC